MAPSPRRLSFAVGTSLLSASLSLGAAGCDDPNAGGKTVNPKESVDEKSSGDAPDSGKAPEEDHVNVGPDEPEPKPTPEPTPEEVHVNEGPQPEPEAAPEDERVNVQPEPEPKRVNVRAPD